MGVLWFQLTEGPASYRCHLHHMFIENINQHITDAIGIAHLLLSQVCSPALRRAGLATAPKNAVCNR